MREETKGKRGMGEGRDRAATTGRSAGRRVLSAGALIAGLAFAMAAHAKSDAPQLIDSPAQPLDQALKQLASQTGLKLSYSSELVAGKTAPAVHGRLAAPQALQQILGASGLQAVKTGDAYLVAQQNVPANTTTDTGNAGSTLPAITVSDNAADTAANAVNPRTTIGSKIPLTQREIPQTVTVIPQEQIQQQNMTTLTDAMRATPGVSVVYADSERTNYYSRGFPIDTWLLDGVASNQNLASIAPNLAMFDRVEVLRGPDGLMNGFGSPGGSLNLVRKQAPSTFSMNAELYGGTYNEVGGMVDVGGPINAAGSLRGRFVAEADRQDLTQDSTWRRSKNIYGTLEADLTSQTKLQIGASYSETDQKAMWTGTPTYSNYMFLNLPRSTYLGAPWNDNTYDITTAFATLTQKLGGGWSTKLAFNYLENRSSILNGNVSGPIDPVTNNGTIGATRWAQDDQQESVDLSASGPFQLLGRTHQLTVGGSYLHESIRTRNFYCSGGNVFCQSTGSIFSSIPEPAFDGPVSDETKSTSQYGLYANTRISLADPLTLVLGARATWWDYGFTPNPAANYWGDATQHHHISGRVTPYAGLIYDINRTYSAYVSYTGIFVPQTGTDVSGNLLQPLEGDQYEIGLKGEYFGGQLNTNIALFQLTEKNRALDDPRYPGQGFVVAAGKARSRGVELTATGQLTSNWSVFGGYTYTNAQFLDASTNADGFAFQSVAPKHLFKLWTNYRLPGNLNRFSVGGGAYVSSGISATDGVGTVRQGTFATFDLRAAYDINKNLTASVSVTNLFDRHYYDSISSTGSSFWGNPRQLLFKLRMQM
ncbi:TonB-dependent siderophore receptor [Paraburkholderia fungorum]|uniref:TonB-dependent siderophore receptor n=1 Tax=Paraburkholderia fungorum TaxID=134537 RepID=UPI0038BAF547